MFCYLSGFQSIFSLSSFYFLEEKYSTTFSFLVKNNTALNVHGETAVFSREEKTVIKNEFNDKE